MRNNNAIVKKMNAYLYEATKELASWLNEMLPKSGEDWWNECVISNLSFHQQEMVQQKGISMLDEFDLAALLRIADKSWYTMRSYAYLPTSERDVIRDMFSVRNNWAHISVELPGKDIILQDLGKMRRFFLQMENGHLVADIENQIKIVEQGEFLSPNETAPAESETSTATTNEITEKSLVTIIGSPNSKGIVFSISEIGDMKKYQVFVDGSFKTFYEGQIALVEKTYAYNWIDAETFRSLLTAYQINNPSSGNLYSLNAARIEFVPYQFRPALKLIKADVPRILIADSVGVGKTIEAGLIIKELQARSDIESILIICPKPLVADRKWEEEMKRFDEDFIPLDSYGLRQTILDTDRDGDWPARYNKVILPYSILDSRVYEGEETKHGKKTGLVNLDPAPHFDLVIIDEAHHLRNGSMDKEKAYTYKCVHYFCEHADAVVMLTATPLQTSDDDLFTLLNLLRPDVIIDKQSFDLMALPNPYISQSSHLVRAAKEGWRNEALEKLDRVLSTQWGEDIISRNPLFNKSRKVLQQQSISPEERVQLITDIESLHSFNTLINRTRRKDIQDFCIRRTTTLESEFTTAQKQLHDDILEFERIALTKLHGSHGVKFLMSTLRRQASSCIFGLAPHIKALVNKRFDQLLDDPDIDISDIKGMDISSLEQMAQVIIDEAEALPNEDPKFDSILRIAREKQKYENNKILIFSTFRFTLAYLRQKLSENGLRVAQIDGSVNTEKRLELRYRFELPKENPDSVDILLFTEVGAEGLDYQFCDTMINYDLPWNPMRIEQRIGRIDRRGQKSEAVNIYNVITNDTVDADIYTRCLLRIGVFENSIGECEKILGEIGRQIEMIAMDSTLTDEERRQKLEQMAENEIRNAQELNRLENEEKELFGFDLTNYIMAKEINAAESPFLSSNSILHLVKSYLDRRLGTGSYILGDNPLKSLRLNAFNRAELLEDYRKLSGTRNSLRKKWELYLKGNEPNHSITFESEIAEANRNAFFITPVHPLVKQAAAYYAQQESAYIHLDYYSDDLKKTDYPFSVYAWDYIGTKPNFRLKIICENEILAKELPDYIVTSSSAAPCEHVEGEKWDALEQLHFMEWKKEKEVHQKETKQEADFKMESIKNNYLNRKLLLERKIAESVDPRITTMYKGELEHVTERYMQQRAEIEAQMANADIHTTLIANGIITVR